MEHPHTVLLGKVLQANIALGNAHTNNSERSRIISRWMDLQQSINVLVDNKTASSESISSFTCACSFQTTCITGVPFEFVRASSLLVIIAVVVKYLE